ERRVSLEQRAHRKRDPGVSAGRLQDRGTRRQQPGTLGLLHHPQRGSVLDGAGRVAVLELAPQPHMILAVRRVVPLRRQPLQPDQRGVPEGLQQRVVASQAAVTLCSSRKRLIAAFCSSRKRLIAAFCSSRKRLIAALCSSRKRLIAAFCSSRKRLIAG